MRSLIGVLRGAEVTAQPPELPDLVVALGCAGAMDVGQVGTDLGGLALGLLPGAGGLQDLRAVHSADAGEQHRRGERGQPLRRRLDPQPGPTQVAQLVAGRYQVAVDVSGPIRQQLPGEHGKHRLVEQGHALGHSPLPEQHPALTEQAHRHQVRVAVPAPDVPHAAGCRDHSASRSGLSSPPSTSSR